MKQEKNADELDPLFSQYPSFEDSLIIQKEMSEKVFWEDTNGHLLFEGLSEESARSNNQHNNLDQSQGSEASQIIEQSRRHTDSAANGNLSNAVSYIQNQIGSSL